MFFFCYYLIMIVLPCYKVLKIIRKRLFQTADFCYVLANILPFKHQTVALLQSEARTRAMRSPARKCKGKGKRSTLHTYIHTSV